VASQLSARPDIRGVPLPGVSSVPVIVDGLAKTYPGGIQALRGISFDVADGEIFGLLGPNGAGKTTTFGILTTTVHPTSGRAFVAGHDVISSPLGVRRAIGVAFQDSVLDNEFSGRDNLRLHARLWKLPRRDTDARIDELLAVMELQDRADDGVRTYSGGMRRRLEIARALLSRPRVLLLDEPTVGLDPAVRDEIWSLIRRLRREAGVTVVLSTHYLEEAEDVCDRVGIINRGELVALGRPAELVENLGTESIELQVAGDSAAAARELVATLRGASSPLVRRDLVSVAVATGTPDLAAQVAALHSDGFGIVGSTTRRTSLADVFAHRTGHPLGDQEER
jgi:ABC-2 type transport system ATP-binding protein